MAHEFFFPSEEFSLLSLITHMVNIYCNFLSTKNGTIRFCILPDKSELFLKKMGNVKLNCHTLRIGFPFGPPSSAEWIWFIIIESDGGSEARWSGLSNGKYKVLLLIQLFISFNLSQ